MISIKRGSGSQTLSVTKGAYNQIYKPLGWTPVQPEKVTPAEPVPQTPVVRKTRAPRK